MKKKLNIFLNAILLSVYTYPCISCSTYYYDLPSLAAALACAGANNGGTVSPDLNYPQPIEIHITDALLLLHSLQLPLQVPDNVILEGDFIFTSAAPGTLITYDDLTSQPCPSSIIWLFSLGDHASIRNISLRGPKIDYQDRNYDGNLHSSGGVNFPDSLSPLNPDCQNRYGGVYVSANSDNCEINGCEFSGFSYASIYSYAPTDSLLVEDCFIHNSKLEGLGYGTWISSATSAPGNMTSNTVNRCIYDDCREGIDLSHYCSTVNITNCSFTQFFFNENINRHGGPVSLVVHHDTLTGTCGFYDHSAGGTPEITVPGNPFNIHDIGGRTTNVDSCLFFQIGANISVPYPRDSVNKCDSSPPGSVIIANSTFATAQTAPACGAIGGYARVADNFIENDCWDGDTLIQTYNNNFSYVTGTGLYPMVPEINLSLTANNQSPPIVFPSSNFDINTSAANSGASTMMYLIRPNTDDGNTMTGNLFYTDEIRTTAGNTPFSYSLPGLYHINVLAADLSTLRSSQWEHTPVIVRPYNLNRPVLIMHIKDSYTRGDTTGFVKTIELINDSGNHTVIYTDDIAGDKGWERIEYQIQAGDLSPVGKVDTLKITLEARNDVDGYLVKGVRVWIDDIYMNDCEANNIISDGDFETAAIPSTWSGHQGWGTSGTFCNSHASHGAFGVALSQRERKSGNSSLTFITTYITPPDDSLFPTCIVTGNDVAYYYPAQTFLEATTTFVTPDFNLHDCIADRLASYPGADFLVSPNPSLQLTPKTIEVQGHFNANDRHVISIYSSDGNLLHEEPFASPKFSLNLHVTPGIYYARIKNGDKTGFKKIVILQ